MTYLGYPRLHFAGAWVFEGPPIRFDPDGVYPMVDDPDTATLPEGTLVKASSRQFNATYTDLLRSLHRTFNGNPAGLREAIGLMYTAEVQATALMRMPIGAGSPATAGPSFQVG